MLPLRFCNTHGYNTHKPQELFTAMATLNLPNIHRNDTHHFENREKYRRNSRKKMLIMVQIGGGTLIHIWQNFYFIFSILKQLTSNPSI
jgi:hypothetical protein